MPTPTQMKEQFKLFVPVRADEAGNLPAEIQIMPLGMWNSPWKGQIIVTKEDCQQIIENFGTNMRAGDTLPIDTDHDGGAANGWITKLFMKEGEMNPNHNGLWGSVEWTPPGKEKLLNKIYKFFSPEWAPLYESPQDGSLVPNVLIGGGLVNRPFFKDMQSVVAHEAKKPQTDGKTGKTDFILFIERDTMTVQDILAKAPADLSAEEKAFLQENQATISVEDREKFGLEVPEAKDEQDGGAAKPADGEVDGDGKDLGDRVEEKIEHPGNSEQEIKAGGTVETASEGMVTMTAAEKAQLDKDAQEGIKAREQIRSMQAAETIKGLIFSEDKGKNKFTPAVQNDLVGLYLSFNDTQKTLFDKVVQKMPSHSMLFTEVGGKGEDSLAGDPASQLRELAIKKQASEKEAGREISYGDALRKVASEHPEISKQHEETKAQTAE